MPYGWVSFWVASLPLLEMLVGVVQVLLECSSKLSTYRGDLSIGDPTQALMRARMRPMAELRVTLVQVAARAGVSKTTAGYVLTGRDHEMRIGEETRHRVLRAAAEMNYRPNLMARSLRTPVDRPIALISDTLVTEPYGGELLQGCLTAAAARGRLTLIGETRRDRRLQAALVEQFLAEQVTAFILATVYPREVPLPRQLRHGRVVTLNCLATDLLASAVLPDEVEGGRMAARTLLEAGHRDGIYLMGDRAPHPYAPGRDRERGLADVLGQAGATLAGALDCAWEPEAAYEALSSALRMGLRPTALVCLNDRVALGAYQALAEAGLEVPAEVSVLCFEGSQLAAWLRPAVTSVDRSLEAMGRRAVELLLATDPPDRPTYLPMTLRRRASVGPPPGR